MSPEHRHNSDPQDMTDHDMLVALYQVVVIGKMETRVRALERTQDKQSLLMAGLTAVGLGALVKAFTK